MSVHLLTPDEVTRALAVRDLTDPGQGRHAMQRLVEDVVAALRRAWRCPATVYRGSRVVPIHDNYDALGYESGAVTRDARYTRYVSATEMLRSHTSALVPGALRAIDPNARDTLLACPGVVYRRDSIDRLHTGTPHQLDLWRITRSRTLTTGDLKEMIDIVVQSMLPGADYRVHDRVHPYTTDGLQVDVANGDEWVEIGECGLAGAHVLANAGVEGSGLAMGLGLDRLMMLRKGIADIRLLRSGDPRVAEQMSTLALYRPVSSHPAVVRDLSIVVGASDDAELLGDHVRDALGDDADAIESVEVVSETAYADLPPVARDRLGARPGHKNVLVRVVLRHATRSLTREEANRLRDRVYEATHQGR